MKRMNRWLLVTASVAVIGAVYGCSGDSEVSSISSQVRPPKSPYKQSGPPKSPLGGIKPAGDSKGAEGAAR